MKLNRVLSDKANKNEYINTYDIREYARLISKQKPDLVVVTVDGEYGRDYVDLARAIDKNVALFWFSNEVRCADATDSYTFLQKSLYLQKLWIMQ